MRVVGYVPDLMDRSKIAAASPGTRFVSTPAELAGAADDLDAELVVVDLSRPGVLDVVSSVAGSRRVMGFASHLDAARLARVLPQGCQVMFRSAFFAGLGAFFADGDQE